MRKLNIFLSQIILLLAMIAFFHMVIFIISLPSLPFLLGNSVNLNCIRLEVNYVNCQQQRIHFYGLWSESVTSLRVKSAVVEEHEIHDYESTYTEYKMDLENNNKLQEFYDYGGDSERALNDKQRVNNFIRGSGNSSLDMKASKNFWGEIGLIYVGFSYVIWTFLGLFFAVFGLVYVISFLENRLGRKF